MTVRRTIVREEHEGSQEEEESISPLKGMNEKAILAHTFGTKRAKKMFENSQLEMNSREHGSKPLSEAILSSMPALETPSAAVGKAALSQTEIIQAAKPLPKPDLQATRVSQTYPLSNLVFPAPYGDTLASMPIEAWRQTVAETKSVQSTSRFISYCVMSVTKAAIKHPSPTSKQTKHLQTLRYILLLIEFSRMIEPGKRLPLPSEWNSTKYPITDYNSLPWSLLDALYTKYSTDPSIPVADPSKNPRRGAIPTSFNKILLNTTILALTLLISPPNKPGASAGVLVTDPSHIQLDLGLKPEDCRRYFRELGCSLNPPTDDEMKMWGVTPSKGEDGVKSRRQFARLKLPLEFPAVKMGKKL